MWIADSSGFLNSVLPMKLSWPPPRCEGKILPVVFIGTTFEIASQMTDSVLSQDVANRMSSTYTNNMAIPSSFPFESKTFPW